MNAKLHYQSKYNKFYGEDACHNSLQCYQGLDPPNTTQNVSRQQKTNRAMVLNQCGIIP